MTRCVVAVDPWGMSSRADIWPEAPRGMTPLFARIAPAWKLMALVAGGLFPAG